MVALCRRGREGRWQKRFPVSREIMRPWEGQKRGGWKPGTRLDMAGEGREGISPLPGRDWCEPSLAHHTALTPPSRPLLLLPPVSQRLGREIWEHWDARRLKVLLEVVLLFSLLSGKAEARLCPQHPSKALAPARRLSLRKPPRGRETPLGRGPQPSSLSAARPGARRLSEPPGRGHLEQKAGPTQESREPCRALRAFLPLNRRSGARGLAGRQGAAVPAAGAGRGPSALAVSVRPRGCSRQPGGGPWRGRVGWVSQRGKPSGERAGPAPRPLCVERGCVREERAWPGDGRAFPRFLCARRRSGELRRWCGEGRGELCPWTKPRDSEHRLALRPTRRNLASRLLPQVSPRRTGLHLSPPCRL